MSNFLPKNPDFQQVIRASFAKQRFMRTLGASLTRVEPGEVDIEIDFNSDLTQQNG